MDNLTTIDTPRTAQQILNDCAASNHSMLDFDPATGKPLARPHCCHCGHEESKGE